MTHEEARRAASRVLDDAVTGEVERDLAVHLVGCAECRLFYDTIRNVRTTRASAAQQPPPFVVDHAASRAATIVRGDPDPGPMPAEQDAESTGEMVAPVRTGERPAASEEGPIADLGPGRTSRRERRAARRELTERKTRRAPWLIAIAGALALAVLAGLIVTRGSVVRERLRPSVPTVNEVRRRAVEAFEGMRTLKTSFRIRRLGLYRQPGDRPVYAFTNATERGRVLYEAPATLREERTLDVPGRTADRTTTLVRDATVDTITETGGRTDRTAVIGAAFGPPDGPLIGRLGVLEQAVTAVLQLLAGAGDARTSQTTYNERPAIRVRFSVAPDELSRADRIDMLVDRRTWLPVRIERTIARAGASVLGPSEVLAEAAIDAQFAGRERLVTELTELDGTTVDETIEPGEFVLAPSTIAPEPSEGRWQRIERQQLVETLPFELLYPTAIPTGFREAGLAMFTGKPQTWGPRRSWAAPDGAMQAMFFDGKSTIVLSERRIARNRDRITGSPLQSGDLPVRTERVVRSGRALEFGMSAVVPPHVYGFVGDVYVVATGYVPVDDLVRLVASLQPVSQPSPSEGVDASPSASPDRSPAPTR